MQLAIVSLHKILRNFLHMITIKILGLIIVVKYIMVVGGTTRVIILI